MMSAGFHQLCETTWHANGATGCNQPPQTSRPNGPGQGGNKSQDGASSADVGRLANRTGSLAIGLVKSPSRAVHRGSCQHGVPVSSGRRVAGQGDVFFTLKALRAFLRYFAILISMKHCNIGF